MKNNLLTEFVFDRNNQSGISFTGDYSIVNQTRADCISDLKKVNIFLGSNNVGKSRIIRSVYSQEDIMLTETVNEFNIFFEELKKTFNLSKYSSGQMPNVKQFIEFQDRLNNQSCWFFKGYPGEQSTSSSIGYINMAIAQIRQVIATSSNAWRLNGEPEFPDKIIKLVDDNLELIEKLNNLPKIHRIYIPVLRGMRTLQTAKSNLFKERTVRDYFLHCQNFLDRKIFTGQEIFDEIGKMVTANIKQRNFKLNYEKFLSDNFFEGKKVVLTALSEEGNDVIHITFENDGSDERAIQMLGDGLQSIICLTYPIFHWLEFEKKSKADILLACIEEPELYLHPSMQRKLVEVLMTKLSDNVQYFMTTHSNNFIDLFSEPEYKDDISIFSVKVNSENIKEVRKEIDLSDSVYNLLGAKPSSLLLANKTIWVEGVSDRIYLRHGIKLYFEENTSERKLVENLDYAFIEYAGSNLQHYVEGEEDINISSISNKSNVFILADKDNSETEEPSGITKKERYSKIKEQLGNKGGIFKITDGREIENYTKPEILRKIWSELPERLEQSEYLGESLPKFMSENSCTLHIKNNSFGSNKKIISEKIIKEQKIYNDLSDDMQNLIIELVNFIR